MRDSDNVVLAKVLSLLADVAKYLLVSLLVMLISLSVATRQFPPPIRQLWSLFADKNHGVDLGSPLVAAQAISDRDRYLNNLEASFGSKTQEAVAINDDTKKMLQERVKVLEYEVALLKSKLNRAESQVRSYEMASPKATVRR